MNSPVPSPRPIGRHRSLYALLALALAVRVYVAIAWPSLHHPDENFQSLEQAHRLAFGYGIKPWEFHDGVRSMLIPWLLGRVFALVARFSAAPEPYLLSAHLLVAALSLLTVWAAWLSGRQFSGRHALIAGLVAASWFQIVNFADRTLSEAMAANFLILAVALAAVAPALMTRRRLLWLGASLALCVAIRTDLAPGALVVACWAGRLRWRSHWLALLLGALPVLLVFGISDWIAWGAPFHSYYELYQRDLLQGVLSGQGTEPFAWLFDDGAQRWGVATLLLLALMGLALRRHTLWIATGAAVFLVHCFIGHKEYRYVYPAYACFVIASALASVDLIDSLLRFWGERRETLWACALAGFWLLLSLGLALQPFNAQDWSTRADFIRASFWLFRQPNLCALMLYDYAWFDTGGYAYLHRPVPMYEWLDHSSSGAERAALAARSATNYVLLKRSSIGQFSAPFTVRRCEADPGPDSMCVLERAGGCDNRLGLTPVQ